ncbi:MAG: hypothetical protein Q8R04_01535 [Nanoarchaeota archaeon]|nr:hypothetical protein [Nanoarchaeota archaeon]
MKRIIIDTNFLLIPYKFKVDIFSEFSRVCTFNYELFIFEQSIDELKSIIEKQSGKSKKAAQFALKLIKLKNIGIIKSGQKDVDSLILESLTEDTLIATQDINLKREILKKGTSVIIIRQTKYLQLVERKLYK